MGVSVPTLRYYDKEGLLPFIEKKENGTRIFKEEDLKSLRYNILYESFRNANKGY